MLPRFKPRIESYIPPSPSVVRDYNAHSWPRDEDEEQDQDDQDNPDNQDNLEHTTRTFWAQHPKTSEFILGFLEGSSAGFVLGLATGGLGFLAIPILGILRGLYRVNKAEALQANFDNKEESFSHQLQAPLMSAAIGAGVGATIGLFLAPFTFGLSLPVCAAIGAGYGLIAGGLNHLDNKKCFNAGTPRKAEKEAHESAEIGILVGGAVGLILAPFTFGISLVVCPLLGAAVGYGVSKVASSLSKSGNKTIHQGKREATSVGAAIGAIVGALLSPFTFGLSIPLCALIGGSCGAAAGRQLPKFSSSTRNCFEALGRCVSGTTVEETFSPYKPYAENMGTTISQGSPTVSTPGAESPLPRGPWG